jgi:hypothetical protein
MKKLLTFKFFQNEAKYTNKNSDYSNAYSIIIRYPYRFFSNQRNAYQDITYHATKFMPKFRIKFLHIYAFLCFLWLTYCKYKARKTVEKHKILAMPIIVPIVIKFTKYSYARLKKIILKGKQIILSLFILNILSNSLFPTTISEIEIKKMNANALKKSQELINGDEFRKEYKLLNIQKGYKNSSNIFVFISFSMPNNLLLQYLEEAKKRMLRLYLEALSREQTEDIPCL